MKHAKGGVLQHQVIELALRRPWTIARGTTTNKRCVVVTVREGASVGRGEAAPIGRFGESVETVIAALPEIDRVLSATGRDDPSAASLALARAHPGDAAARAAVSAALFDLAGKARGVPLHRMLGIDPAAMPPTSFSIGLDEPALIEEKVREAAPYAILKVKLGGADDRAVLAAVRRATGKPVRVDANEAWTDPARALATIEELATMGVELVEQPVPAADLEGARWLFARSPLPIVADEAACTSADVPRLAGAYHGVNVKLQKCGGVAEALRIVEAARAHGMKTMIGCMIESSLGIAAAAQIAPLFDWVDLDGNLLVRGDPFVGHPVENGRIALSGAPGLGAEPAR